MKTQEFTSKSTSINANRLPVVFSTITNKAAALNIDLENTMVLDSGCGAFPGIISKHFEDRGAGYAGRDPYNQPESVNAEFIPAANKALRAGQDRIFTSSNVLNVICAAKFRAAYLESIAEIMRPGEKLYITVYEGDRSGNAGFMAGKPQIQIIPAGGCAVLF